MTGIPPAIFIHLFLYQLRAFVNAGFRKIVVLSGHSGGNQKDLRFAAEAFMKRFDVEVWVRSDPELVEDQYEGDHAGKYEISQLMYIRPDLIDMDKAALQDQPGSGGRLALGADAGEANPELGKKIMEACLKSMVEVATRMKSEATKVAKEGEAANPRIPYADAEAIWSEVSQYADKWVTANPWPSQEPVSSLSQWKPYEHYEAGR
jgi:creatinine amidohydrolase